MGGPRLSGVTSDSWWTRSSSGPSGAVAPIPENLTTCGDPARFAASTNDPTHSRCFGSTGVTRKAWSIPSQRLDRSKRSSSRSPGAISTLGRSQVTGLRRGSAPGLGPRCPASDRQFLNDLFPVGPGRSHHENHRGSPPLRKSRLVTRPPIGPGIAGSGIIGWGRRIAKDAQSKSDTDSGVSMAIEAPWVAAGQPCPVEVTLGVIGGKWKVIILYWLKSPGPSASAS